MIEAKKKMAEVESQLGMTNSDAEGQKKELHEMECQLAALTKRLDHANEHHRLATEALEASNKETTEKRQWTEAQVDEIGTLKETVKVAGELAVQHFIDHFEKHPLF